MMRVKTNSALLCACIMVIQGVTWAGEKEEALIDKVVAAYGGEQLLSVKTLKLVDKYQSFRAGQNHSPDETDMFHRHYSVTVDLVNQRSDFRFKRGLLDETSIEQRVFDGKMGYQIDHTARTVSKSARLSFAKADRYHLFYLDTALAILLNNTRKQATYVGEEDDRLGVAHDVISFKAEGYPQTTLYVNKANGRIAKMQRAYGKSAKYNYCYSGHQYKQGRLYAASTYITRAGKAMHLSVSRKLEFNPDVTNAFSVPADYGTAIADLDLSKMTTQKLADNVYLSGRWGGYSTFIDTGEYFIGAGGYAQLTKRFEATKTFAGVDKPLKYLVVSHHHDDHLGGMKEAAELGVTFITVESHKDSIRDMAKQELPDDRFIIVDEQGSFADGAVKVLDFPNPHASHNLMTYFPLAKTLFTADLFFTWQESGAPKGNPTLKVFRSKLKQAGFAVEQFAAAHSGRVLTAADLDKSIETIVKVVCPADWEICAN
jgi:glyoxylase-like metal-dependent hydrolase (beta-lactamase superfamily II)